MVFEEYLRYRRGERPLRYSLYWLYLFSLLLVSLLVFKRSRRAPSSVLNLLALLGPVYVLSLLLVSLLVAKRSIPATRVASVLCAVLSLLALPIKKKNANTDTWLPCRRRLCYLLY